MKFQFDEYDFQGTNVPKIILKKIKEIYKKIKIKNPKQFKNLKDFTKKGLLEIKEWNKFLNTFNGKIVTKEIYNFLLYYIDETLVAHVHNRFYNYHNPVEFNTVENKFKFKDNGYKYVITFMGYIPTTGVYHERLKIGYKERIYTK